MRNVLQIIIVVSALSIGWQHSVLLSQERLPAIPSLPKLETAEAYVERGERLIMRELFRRAVDDFSSALDLEPKNVRALVSRANAQRLFSITTLQQKEQVKKDLDSALVIAPKDPAALRSLARYYLSLDNLDMALATANKAIEVDPSQSENYQVLASYHRSAKNESLALIQLNKAIELFPKDSDCYAARADLFCIQKQYEKANADYEAAVNLATTPAQQAAQLAKRAQCYAAQKDYEHAIQDVQRAITLDPDSPNLHRKLGWMYNDRGDKAHSDFERGIAACNEALRIDSYYFAAYEERAYSNKQLGKFDKAKIDYDKAIEIAPDNAKNYRERGALGKVQNQFAEAIADYTKAIELEPSNAANYNFRGLVYSQVKNPQSAITDYTKAIDLDPKSVTYLGNRAATFKKLEQYNQAIADYTKAIELEPSNAANYNYRGLAYSLMKNPQSAITDYTKAIELDPKSVVYLTNRANAFKELQQYDEAIADYTKAIELEPSNAAHYYHRGLVYSSINRSGKRFELPTMKNPQSAVTDFTKAIELDPKSAIYLRNRADIFRILQQYDKAIADSRKAIEIEPSNADNYNYRGLAYSLMKNPQSAVTDYTKAIELDPKSATYLRNRADAFRQLKQYDEASADYTKAIELAPKSVICLLDRAKFYNELKEYERALADCDQAFEIEPGNSDVRYYRPKFYDAKRRHEEEIISKSNPTELAAYLRKRAETYKQLDLYDKAIADLKRAIEITDKPDKKDYADTATSLSDLAKLYHSQAKYDDALQLFKRALEIRAKTLGQDNLQTLISHYNLANLFVSQAKYAEALMHIQVAVRFSEKSTQPEHRYTASFLETLAQIYILQGNYAEAIPPRQRALKLTEKLFGPDHPETASSLASLARIYALQANYSEAISLLDRALRTDEKSLRPDDPKTLSIIESTVYCYNSQGDYAKAIPLCRRALDIAVKAYGPSHPETATISRSLATAYALQGNYAEAIPFFQRSLEIAEKSLGPDHPDTASSLSNLGVATEESGGTNSDEPFHRSIRSIVAHSGRTLPSLSSNEQELFVKEHFNGAYRIALSQALRHPDQAANSASWPLNSKGIIQDVLSAQELVSRDINDSKLGTVVSALQNARQQLSVIAMKSADSSDQAKKRETIEQLNADVDRLSRELAQATGSKIVTGNWIELDDLRKTMPQDAVFVDIARFDVYNFDAKERKTKWADAHYAAWITPVAGKGDVHLVDLGLASEIDALVEPIRKAMEPGGFITIKAQGEEEATKAFNASMQQLAERIWKPLEPHLGDARQIILSPDGALWLVPWTALPVDSEDHLMIESYSLRLVTSGREVLSTKTTKLAVTPPVIFADPNFDSTSIEKKKSIEAVLKTTPPADNETLRSFSAKSLLPKAVRLPNTASEAKFIQPNIDKLTGSKTTLYESQYALESIAKKAIRPKVAVFATHGFFLPAQEAKKDNPIGISLGDQSRSIALDTQGKPIENPLLRCGLLLAGCNNRDAVVGDDDGILTGMEIVGIDFRGTDLVVLSACETGVGDIKSGEGVAGLRQAFQLAGAKAVVASLWQVPDRDSAIIMNDFFTNVATGSTASEAMRQSQLNRIEARRKQFGAAHPIYWAAWTVTE